MGQLLDRLAGKEAQAEGLKLDLAGVETGDVGSCACGFCTVVLRLQQKSFTGNGTPV